MKSILKQLSEGLEYLIGNYREKLYYNYPSCLLRSHIKEQIVARILSMDRKCYLDGECKICGCTTTALQMANKACDKPCYPKILGRRNWDRLKKGDVVYPSNSNIGWILTKHNKFQKHAMGK